MDVSRPLSLVDIFHRSIFRVPDYQRGYSWSINELEDYWNDIIRLTDEKKHYCGLLTLKRIEENEVRKWIKDKWLADDGYRFYYVVDGQQRLATSIILIQTILNKVPDNTILATELKGDIKAQFIRKEMGGHRSYFFSYLENDPCNKYMMAKIFRDIDYPDYNEPLTSYTFKLEGAEIFFKEQLSNMSIEEMTVIYKKVRSKLMFYIFEINDISDENVVFETLNFRGLRLSTLELLKNRLLYLTTLFKSDEPDGPSFNRFEEERKNLRVKINESWGDVYTFLGKNKDNVLSDDDFLKNHYFMYFGYDPDDHKKFRNHLLDRHFTAQRVTSNKLKMSEINQYVGSLKKAALEWFNIKNPYHSNASLSSEEKFWLDKILRLKKNSAYLLCILAFRIVDVKGVELVGLLKKMERSIFLTYDLSRVSGNTVQNFFYRRAKAIFNKKLLTQGFNKDLDDRTKKDWQSSLFHNYISKQFQKTSESTKIGFYAWSGLNYLLFEYETELMGKEEPRVGWSAVKDSVEHICPKTPKDNCWLESFSDIDNPKWIRLKNSLGNLLLLSRSKNSKLSNRCFADKKKYQKIAGGEVIGYSNGSYSEIEVSENETWGPKEIEDRGLKMLEFLERRWSVNLGDRDTKVKLLGF